VKPRTLARLASRASLALNGKDHFPPVAPWSGPVWLAGFTQKEVLLPATTRDLTQALYVAAVALGRTRDAEEVVRVAIAETQRASGIEAVSLHLLLSPGISDVVAGAIRSPVPLPEESITAREREVLQLVAEGKTTKEISAILGVSVKAADAHRTRLMQKLNIHDIAGLTRYAIRRGLIQP